MRLATWNVNSVGARLPRLLPWLQEVAPDVVALQETKCADAAFPYAELRALGYEAAHAGDGRWNGVALLSRVGLEDVDLVQPHPGQQGPEPRLVAAQCGPLHVTCVYVPNGRSLDDPHYAYKLAWLAGLLERLGRQDLTGPVVVTGGSSPLPGGRCSRQSTAGPGARDPGSLLWPGCARSSADRAADF